MNFCVGYQHQFIGGNSRRKLVHRLSRETLKTSLSPERQPVDTDANIFSKTISPSLCLTCYCNRFNCSTPPYHEQKSGYLLFPNRLSLCRLYTHCPLVLISPFCTLEFIGLRNKTHFHAIIWVTATRSCLWQYCYQSLPLGESIGQSSFEDCSLTHGDILVGRVDSNLL